MSEQAQKKTNATVRLVALLDSLQGSNSAKATIQVLTEKLNVTTDNEHRSALMASAMLSQMLEAAEGEAKTSFSDDWEVIGSPYSELRTCLTPSAFGIPWNQRKSWLTARILTGLQHTAVHLKRQAHELELELEDFQEFEQAIDELKKITEDDVSSEEVRDLLLGKANNLREAARNYRFLGISGIKSAHRDAIGTLLTDERLKAEITRNARAKGDLWKKIKKVISATTLLLTLATAGYDTAKDYIPLIESQIFHQQLPEKAPMAPPTVNIIINE